MPRNAPLRMRPHSFFRGILSPAPLRTSLAYSSRDSPPIRPRAKASAAEDSGMCRRRSPTVPTMTSDAMSIAAEARREGEDEVSFMETAFLNDE